MDIVCRFVARFALASAGVKVVRMVRARPRRDSWGADTGGIIVANHLSNLDPFAIALGLLDRDMPKFVGKKVLFLIPIFGWALLASGMVPINRGNRKKAIEALNSAVSRIMMTYNRSVALFVEGTRSRDGNLILPFKKGAFHMQQQTRAPLLPAVMFGAFKLWPSSHFFCRTGRIHVRILPSVGYDSSKSIDQRRIELQQRMVDAIYCDDARSLQREPLTWIDQMEILLILSLFIFVMHSLWTFYALVFSMVDLTFDLIVALTIVVSTGISAYIHFFV